MTTKRCKNKQTVSGRSDPNFSQWQLDNATVWSVSILCWPNRPNRQGFSQGRLRKQPNSRMETVQFLEKLVLASMFCELLCNVIPAHHILAAGGVSCCHFLRRRPGHSVTLPTESFRADFLPMPVSFFLSSIVSLIYTLPFSAPFAASASVGERERPVPRPPLVVPHRVRHAQALPCTPHPPRVWRLCWHHTTLLCPSAAKLQCRYESMSVTVLFGRVLASPSLLPDSCYSQSWSRTTWWLNRICTLWHRPADRMLNILALHTGCIEYALNACCTVPFSVN